MGNNIPTVFDLLEFSVPSDVGGLQSDDPTLKSWFEKITEIDAIQQGQVSCLEEAVYLIKGGVLYERKGKSAALILPQQFRLKVMELGHTVPWPGHMAFWTTLNRISDCFVWPRMYIQIFSFCYSCETCQLMLGNSVTRGSLEPMLVTETPFEWIVMDIVSPLEKSSASHRYILVICDYATWYPKCFPLGQLKQSRLPAVFFSSFLGVGIAKFLQTVGQMFCYWSMCTISWVWRELEQPFIIPKWKG